MNFESGLINLAIDFRNFCCVLHGNEVVAIFINAIRTISEEKRKAKKICCVLHANELVAIFINAIPTIYEEKKRASWDQVFEGGRSKSSGCTSNKRHPWLPCWSLLFKEGDHWRHPRVTEKREMLYRNAKAPRKRSDLAEPTSSTPKEAWQPTLWGKRKIGVHV